MVVSELFSCLAREENVRQKGCLQDLDRQPLNVVQPTQTNSTTETPIPASGRAISKGRSDSCVCRLNFSVVPVLKLLKGSPCRSVNRGFLPVFHWVRKWSIYLIFQILYFIPSAVQRLPCTCLHVPFWQSL